MAKQNDYYTSVTPIRLTEKQDSEIKTNAKKLGVTVNHLVRDTLTEAGVISAGPENKARKGFGKTNQK